jgi:hypothetical protein
LFWRWGSHFLPRPAWTVILLLYASCQRWDNRQLPLCPAVGGDGVLQTFLRGLALNCNPFNLSLPSSWGFRCEPLAPISF